MDLSPAAPPAAFPDPAAPTAVRPAATGPLSATHLTAAAAFLALAGLDVLGNHSFAAGNWWLVLLLVWLMPWPTAARDLHSTQGWQRWLLQLSSLLVISWLHYRSMDALLQPTVNWRLPGDHFWTLLTIPLLGAVASCLTAVMLARPIHRVFGREALGAAFLIACPFLIMTCKDTVFDLSRWFTRPKANAIWLFEAVFPMLVLMQSSVVLRNRSTNAQPSPQVHRLHELYARCSRRYPTWISRSLLGPLIVLATVACIVRLSFALDVVRTGWSYVAIALMVPTAALMLTGGVVFELRRRRTAALPPLGFWNRLRLPTDLAVALLFLLPLWAWTLILDAPLAEHYARDSIATIPGPDWAVTYDPRSRTIHISGEFQMGLGRAFTSELADAKDATTVHLDSPGGSESEALRIALAIESRELNTLVDKECMSACTVAFLAGRSRTLHEDALLGFHAASSPVLVPWGLNGTFEHYMSERGVSRDFVERSVAVPSDDMWYPHNDTLLSAGVVTHILAGRD